MRAQPAVDDDDEPFRPARNCNRRCTCERRRVKLPAQRMAHDELFLHENGIRIATCGPVFINMFLAPPTVSRVAVVATHQRELRARLGRHAVLSIVDPAVGREMADDARKSAQALSDEMAPVAVAMCFAILGTGFFGAMARSVVAGIQLVSRQRAPWRVVADPHEGASFLVGQLRAESIAVDERALDDVVTRMMAGATLAAS